MYIYDMYDISIRNKIPPRSLADFIPRGFEYAYGSISGKECHIMSYIIEEEVPSERLMWITQKFQDLNLKAPVFRLQRLSPQTRADLVRARIPFLVREEQAFLYPLMYAEQPAQDSDIFQASSPLPRHV